MTTLLQAESPKRRIRKSKEITPLKENKICFSSDVYTIDFQSYVISGINPKTTIAAFKKKLIFNGYTLDFINIKGNTVTRGYITTGTKIECFLGGKKEMEFKCVVHGDLTGTGTITQKDKSILIKHLIGQITLKDEFLTAADVNNDSIVNIQDLAHLCKRLKKRPLPSTPPILLLS